MNFRDPAANLVDDSVIIPPLRDEHREENEERLEDVRGNLDEAMERAMQASAWTRNVVGRANIAVSSSGESLRQQAEFSEEKISEWMSNHPINSRYMTLEDVNMAISSSDQLRLDVEKELARRGNGVKRRAPAVSDNVKQDRRERVLEQCMHVSEIAECDVSEPAFIHYPSTFICDRAQTVSEAEESRAKRQRKNEINMSESLNVVVSGLNSTPSNLQMGFESLLKLLIHHA